jgi:hypothetical protein
VLLDTVLPLPTFDRGKRRLRFVAGPVAGPAAALLLSYCAFRLHFNLATADLAKVLLNWKQQSCFQRDEDWVFPNPATEKPYWQEEIQKKHIKSAAEAAGLGTGIGWHTFRHYAEFLNMPNDRAMAAA